MSDQKDNPSKKLLGLPVQWNRKAILKNFWNKEDNRLFPPKQFGIGWDINFHAVLREIGLIKKKSP